MEAGTLFVEFLALACVVELSFKVARVVRGKRQPKSPQMAASSGTASATAGGRNDWYCFFKPSTFRRPKAARKSQPARTRVDARPRARMSFK